MKALKDFINESVVNEGTSFLDNIYCPDNWDLVSIFSKIKGNPSNLKNIDMEDYFDEYEEYKKDIDKLMLNFFKSVDRLYRVDLGNLDEGAFEDEMVREEAGIADDECGFALHKDGDDATWTICILKKDINSLPVAQEKAIFNLLSKYEDEWYIIEHFDTI